MLRRGIEARMGEALVVAMVGVLSAAAEARSITTTQEAAQDADANPAAARVVVVAAGDSLWSISAERLGAGATPQQVAKGVERIYGLNQNRIGPDPNLIFGGQRLSLPATGSGVVAHANAKATPPAAWEDASTAAATSPKEGSAGHAISTEKVPSLGGEAPSLPKAVVVAPAVPAARQAASGDSPTNGSPVAFLLRDARSVAVSAASAVDESLAGMRAAADNRSTLGWRILVLTVTVGALMASKLSMRRTTSSEAQWRGMPTGYYGGGRYTSHSGGLDMLVPTAKPEASREQSPERLTEQFAPAAQPSGALLPVAIGPSINNGSKANGSEANGTGSRLREASEQRSDELAGKG